MIAPGTETVYRLPQRLLTEARAFFQARGQEGCEGTALLIGHAERDHIQLTRLAIPDQRCIKTPLEDGRWGLRVELTERAHYTLTDTLSSGDLIYARIHSHPGKAFHSPTDDGNGVISHQGAISIVVPSFAADTIELHACAIYRLELGRGWLPIGIDEIERLFQVIHD